jgi:hypothetical protein
VPRTRRCVKDSGTPSISRYQRVLVTVGENVPGEVGGTVPETLSLTLGAPATFGAFVPGVAAEYTATTTANVISTAGDATLSVSEPGHLANGAFTLPQPLGYATSNARTGRLRNGLGSGPRRPRSRPVGVRTARRAGSG